MKNVQYLIKGTITDFGQVAVAHGFASTSQAYPIAAVAGSTSTAVMSMTLSVIDVQSGEVIASQRIQESVNAGTMDFRATYHDIAFGGGMFAKTPLGQATTRAIDKAVARITDSIARTPWQPKIATVDDQRVILNGGSQRGLKPGQEFEVLAPPVAVLDPDTGDIITQKRGRALGHIRILQVDPSSATATITEGESDFPVGAVCQFVAKK